MLIYPAIDLKNNRCVRLLQGDARKETVYSDDPVKTAASFKKSGSQWIHVVDLDGAFDGVRHHTQLVNDIKAETKLNIQLGGGIRSMKDIELCMHAGVNRVIIGTAAHNDPQFLSEAVNTFGDAVAVGLDARNGCVATAGWTHQTNTPVLELARRVVDAGVSTIIYTDIAVDGMLDGPDIATIELLQSHLECSVIASGGIGSLSHLTLLLAAQPHPPEGCIIGKAIYEKHIILEDAIALAAQETTNSHRS
jgi:phosphoribosylformimino-5-aminoimidazole carboxamide ribotide isomerase